MKKKSLVIQSLLIMAIVSVSTLTFSQEKVGKVLNESPIIYSEGHMKSIMKKVCDWQLQNINEDESNTGWVRGAFLTGLMATYYTTEDEKYLSSAMELAQQNDWQPGSRTRHADDQCVAQTYAELYFIKRDKKMIEPIIENFDLMIEDPKWGPEVGWSKSKNWSWCDALFMAPPALVRIYRATGEMKYLDLMNKMWWNTYEYLYDKQAHLFYRDESYKLKRTPNGEKIFWGRGNGWVIAGIARVLQYLPKDYEDYSKYKKLYKEMCERLGELQQQDGLWRSSLNDPHWYSAPETSSSGFICYAFAWGVNNGILSQEKYMPKIKKAWEGLVWSVEENGKLGWVQATGSGPDKVTREDTQEYGVGAFLLAGSEVIKLYN